MIWLIHQPHALTDTIREVLEADGYQSYDPFPGGTGSPVGKLTRLRLFVAPATEEWGRVLVGDPVPEPLMETLGETLTFIDVQLLPSEDYRLTVYRPGVSPSDDLAALVPFLRADSSAADLQKVAIQALPEMPEGADLPPELQQFARQQGVQAKHVDNLMGRMTRRIFRRMEQEGEAEETKNQAIDALKGQAVDWSSPAGQRVRMIMACLTVPEGWYQPTWKALSAAYPLARQQQRGADLLLPGDKDTLNAVPDALDYIPLYYAKKL